VIHVTLLCLLGTAIALEPVPGDVDRTVCPRGSVGEAPNCVCTDDAFILDTIYWTCRVKLYLPVSTTTYKPVPTCGGHQTGIWPDCHWLPCPNSYIGSYWPDCTFNLTINVIPIGRSCPDGQQGTYPYCYIPCTEPYTIRVGDECVPIECPKGAGWSGKYLPDCKFEPSCPPEFPGVWPDCNKYRTTSATKKPFTTPKIKTDSPSPTTKKPFTTTSYTTPVTVTKSTPSGRTTPVITPKSTTPSGRTTPIITPKSTTPNGRTTHPTTTPVVITKLTTPYKPTTSPVTVKSTTPNEHSTQPTTTNKLTTPSGRTTQSTTTPVTVTKSTTPGGQTTTRYTPSTAGPTYLPPSKSTPGPEYLPI